jgi:hypothetical protein
MSTTAVAVPVAAADTYANVMLPGAYGKLSNIDWSSTSTSRVDFTFLVQDIAADGDHAEARAQMKSPNGQITSFRWHSAVGYGVKNQFDTYIEAGSAIGAIRIQVCRRGDDLPDICEESHWVYQDW